MPSWSQALERHSGYSEPQLAECAEALANLHHFASQGSLTAVYKKYSSPQQLRVATMESPVARLCR